MSEEKEKNWRNSKYKWAYLKVALIHFVKPSTVYEIAHRERGQSLRERNIRARLVQLGVLRRESSHQRPDMDLEKGHI